MRRKYLKMTSNPPSSDVLEDRCIPKEDNGILDFASFLENEKIFRCDECKKTFSQSYNLKRHKKLNRCKKKDKVNDLQQQIRQYEEELRRKDEELRLERHNKALEKKLAEKDAHIQLLREMNQEKQAYILSGKAGNTYNLSVKNFCDKHFIDAPPLESLPLETLETLGSNIEGQTKMEKLLYEYESGSLVEYLGGFIIKHYKKKNEKRDGGPAKQSVWASDIARLNYIIRECLEDDRVCWMADKKGLRVREKIICPILEHIKLEIKEFQEDDPYDIETHSHQYWEYNQKRFVCEQIKKEIDNKIIEDSLLKYIAPVFSLDTDDYKDALPITYDPKAKHVAGYTRLYVNQDD